MCAVLPFSLFHADGMPKNKGSLSDNVQTRDLSIPTSSPHAARSPNFHDITPTEDNGGTFHVNLPQIRNTDGISPGEAARGHYFSSYINFNRYFHFPHAQLVALDKMGIPSEDSTPDITRIHSLESMDSISTTTGCSELKLDRALSEMDVKDDREGSNVPQGQRLFKQHKRSQPKVVEKNSNSSKPKDHSSETTGVFPRKDSLALDSYISLHKDGIRLQSSGMAKSKPKTEPPNQADTFKDTTKANEVHILDYILTQKDDTKINEAVELKSKSTIFLPDDLITFKGRANKSMESDVDPMKSRVSAANRRLMRYSTHSSPVGEEIGRVRFNSDVDILEYDADTSSQCLRCFCCCYRAPPTKEDDINQLQPGNSILVKTNYSTDKLTENVCLHIRDEVLLDLDYSFKE